MELMNTIFIVLPILTLLMFDLGLTLRPHDFQLILQRPLPVLAGIIGQIILLPLIAWAVGYIFHLEALFFLGIMLIACSPGGSSSNVFSMLARGDVALSVTLTACSSIITLFTVPLIMAWVTTSIGTGADVHLPVGNLLIQNIVLMAVPILIGLGVGMKWTSAANRIHNVLKRGAFPALILLATVFFLQHKETIVREFPSLGFCITVLILLAMSGGALLSYIFQLKGWFPCSLVSTPPQPSSRLVWAHSSSTLSPKARCPSSSVPALPSSHLSSQPPSNGECPARWLASSVSRWSISSCRHSSSGRDRNCSTASSRQSSSVRLSF